MGKISQLCQYCRGIWQQQDKKCGNDIGRLFRIHDGCRPCVPYQCEIAVLLGVVIQPHNLRLKCPQNVGQGINVKCRSIFFVKDQLHVLPTADRMKALVNLTHGQAQLINLRPVFCTSVPFVKRVCIANM